MPRPRKAPARYEAMTREQLITRLSALEANGVNDAGATQALIHDLEVHQIELEMQNRELREAHAAMEESREKLADLYDHAPVVYLAMDERAGILEANLTACALFGIARPQLIGRLLTNLVVERDRRVLLEHVHRCIDTSARVENEVTFSVPGQPPVIAQLASVPLFDASGRVTGCKTTVVDVTAFKRAQEKLLFLASASATLASSFDFRATLAQVARQAVPVLADICVVDLVDGGELRRLEVAFADPARAQRLAPSRGARPRVDERTPVGWVLRTREPLLIPECAPGTPGSTTEGFDHEVLLEPRVPVPVTISLWATSNLFASGHRIRVDISSSNWPRLEVNPNTGEAIGRHTHQVVAEQAVYVDARRPSSIVLPVIPR